jgi:hypothetical protein
MHGITVITPNVLLPHPHTLLGIGSKTFAEPQKRKVINLFKYQFLNYNTTRKFAYRYT